jgi:hypothetical protein
MAEYAIPRNSGFWLDNWRSACPERLFLMPKSRYFIKAEVVNIQTFFHAGKLSVDWNEQEMFSLS